MPSNLLPADAPAPLAIGGVGGSGTRVVAAAAIALGHDLGADLNPPLDNLGFTLLFKDQALDPRDESAIDQRVRLLLAASAPGGRLHPDDLSSLDALCREPRPAPGPVEHPVPWLRERADRLRASVHAPRSRPGPWGWKEPNTHVWLPALMPRLPGLRYVHVVRNGLDMALSANLNQLSFWGEAALGRPVRREPADALAYWCHVHRRVLDIAPALHDRFLWLDYDALCDDPVAGMARLLAFLGQPPDRAGELAGMVQPSSGRRRHEGHSLETFDPADLAFLRQLGHLGPASL